MTDQEYDALINSMSSGSPSYDDLDFRDLTFDFDTSGVENLDLSGLSGMNFDSLGLEGMLAENFNIGGFDLPQDFNFDPNVLSEINMGGADLDALIDSMGSQGISGLEDVELGDERVLFDGAGQPDSPLYSDTWEDVQPWQNLEGSGTTQLSDAYKYEDGKWSIRGNYDEETGRFVPDPNGTFTANEENGFDPLRASGTNKESMDGYTYDKKSGTWTTPRGEVYTPKVTPTHTTKSGAQVMVNAGALPSGYAGLTPDRGSTASAPTTTKTGDSKTSTTKPDNSATPQGGLGALLPLLLALLAMNRGGGGGGGGQNAVIPALTATQRQTPYAQQQRAPGYRPGQGGITYFDQTQYAPKMASGGIVTLSEGGQTATVNEGDAAEQTGNYTITKNSVKSGRIATELDQRGQPSKFVYYSPEGKRLRTSTFSVPELLKNAQKYGIDLRDTLGVAAGLEKAGVGYKPGELYKGTGSDHGIDFRDLLSGGFGTSYNWADDPYAAQKGPSAVRRLAENKKLAEYLKLARSDLTSSSGVNPIDLSSLAQLGIKDNLYSHAVQTPGGAVSWYSDPVRAAAEAKRLGGNLVDISNRPVVQMGNRNALDMIEDQLGMQAGSGTYSLPTDSFHNFQTTNPYVAPVKRPVRQSLAPDPMSASRGSIDRDVESDVRNLIAETTANNAVSRPQTVSGVTPYTQTQQAAGYRPGQGGITYLDPMRYAPKMAAGGGIARLLKGPGDGVSDSIPAMIGGEGMAGGGQPAKLARGEYVIDARTVAALGNGSTDAGAERLDKMRKDILRDDRKAGVGKDSKAYRHLLA